jgi:hypothetical protein
MQIFPLVVQAHAHTGISYGLSDLYSRSQELMGCYFKRRHPYEVNFFLFCFSTLRLYVVTYSL